MNNDRAESFWSLVINYCLYINNGCRVMDPEHVPDLLGRALEAANTWALAPALGMVAEPATRPVVALGTAAESMLSDLGMLPESVTQWDTLRASVHRWAPGRELFPFRMVDDPARPGAYIFEGLPNPPADRF